MGQLGTIKTTMAGNLMEERLKKLEYIISGNGRPGLNERVRKIEAILIRQNEQKNRDESDRKKVFAGIIVGVVVLLIQLAVQIATK
jgi:hypothetical protein